MGGLAVAGLILITGGLRGAALHFSNVIKQPFILQYDLLTQFHELLDFMCNLCVVVLQYLVLLQHRGVFRLDLLQLLLVLRVVMRVHFLLHVDDHVFDLVQLFLDEVFVVALIEQLGVLDQLLVGAECLRVIVLLLLRQNVLLAQMLLIIGRERILLRITLSCLALATFPILVFGEVLKDLPVVWWPVVRLLLRAGALRPFNVNGLVCAIGVTLCDALWDFAGYF